METKKAKGFAALTPEQRKAIASMGGKSIPFNIRSFYKDRNLAVEAGRKGGAETARRAIESKTKINDTNA